MPNNVHVFKKTRELKPVLYHPNNVGDTPELAPTNTDLVCLNTVLADVILSLF